jgi:hypothetical protein
MLARTYSKSPWWLAPPSASRSTGTPSPGVASRRKRNRGQAGSDPCWIAANEQAADPPVGGDRRLALHPAEPPQRLRPLGRGVPRLCASPIRTVTHLPPTPLQRMWRTLHHGARHVLPRRGTDPPPPQQSANSPETQDSLPRSATVPSGTTRERQSSIRQQLQRDESLHINDDDGSTRKPPSRRQRQVLQHCCNCSRSLTCALSRPTACSLACPCRVASKRCTSCTCFNHSQNKRALLPPPTTATLRCFFTNPSATATTEAPPAAESNPQPQPVPLATESPPAPPQQASQQSTTTTAMTDDDGDDGTTQEDSLARAFTQPPEETNDLSPAHAEPETVVDAGVTADPVCPPTAAAPPATRADSAVADDPEAAPAPVITPDEGANLPDYVVTEADRLLDTALGDHAHDNAGTHLDGGVATDALWQRWWRRMAQLPTTRFQAPAGKVGRRFLTILAAEFRGIRERLWNSERPLMFAATVLQTTQGVRRAKDICRRLAQRMDLWDQGYFKALVDDTEGEIMSRRPSSRPSDAGTSLQCPHPLRPPPEGRQDSHQPIRRWGPPAGQPLLKGGSTGLAGASGEALCPPQPDHCWT